MFNIYISCLMSFLVFFLSIKIKSEKIESIGKMKREIMKI